jgi:hypothetical protein
VDSAARGTLASAESQPERRDADKVHSYFVMRNTIPKRRMTYNT